MINSYCRMCGLYVSVPATFAGGRGACPRCKVLLQIPTPLPPDSPHYVEGLRYIAEPAARPLPPGTVSVIVTEDLGPSIRYDCEHCKNTFESLQAPEWPQGQCPSCARVYDNTVGHIVSFPRQFASAGQARPSESEIQAASGPGQVLWDMQGEFLVAKPDPDQTMSDSVIEPLPFAPIPVSEAGTPQPVTPEPVPVTPNAEKPSEPKPVQPKPVPPRPMEPQAPQPAPVAPPHPEPVPVKPKAEQNHEPEPENSKSEPVAPEPAKPHAPEPLPVSPKHEAGQDSQDSKEESDDQTPTVPTPDVSKHDDIEGKWFYLLGGKEVGPVSTEEIQELVRSGKASNTVFVWQDGMESWAPIEEIEELNVERRPEAEASFTHSSMTLSHRTSKLVQNSNSLIWMAITAICVVILFFVMRHSLLDFGAIVVKATAAALSFFMLLGILGGIWISLRDFRLFVRGSTTMQMKWLGGIGGLFTCIVLILMIGWQSARAPTTPTEAYAIKKAKEISDTLVFKDLQASFNLVDWSNLIVDGDDFGEKYQQARLMDKKLDLMEEVYEVYINAFDPPYDRQHMRANALENWRIKVQTVDKTVVAAFSPSTGAEIRFILQGDRLFGLSIVPPEEDYKIKKARREREAEKAAQAAQEAEAREAAEKENQEQETEE